MEGYARCRHASIDVLNDQYRPMLISKYQALIILCLVALHVELFEANKKHLVDSAPENGLFVKIRISCVAYEIMSSVLPEFVLELYSGEPSFGHIY